MHQNRASPFASDFYRRRGYRREFRSEGHFSHFLRRRNRGSLAIFFAGEIAHLGASKNRAIFGGAVKIAAAAAENRAILVHSGRDIPPRWGLAKGSSVSWVAKFRQDELLNASCQMDGREVTG